MDHPSFISKRTVYKPGSAICKLIRHVTDIYWYIQIQCHSWLLVPLVPTAFVNFSCFTRGRGDRSHSDLENSADQTTGPQGFAVFGPWSCMSNRSIQVRCSAPESRASEASVRHRNERGAVAFCMGDPHTNADVASPRADASARDFWFFWRKNLPVVQFTHFKISKNCLLTDEKKKLFIDRSWN